MLIDIGWLARVAPPAGLAYFFAVPYFKSQRSSYSIRQFHDLTFSNRTGILAKKRDAVDELLGSKTIRRIVSIKRGHSGLELMLPRVVAEIDDRYP